MAAINLAALPSLIRLPWLLVSSRGHDTLLNHYRMSFISARLGAASIFLCVATIAWIPVDIALFGANWNILVPLTVGRLISAALFFAIGRLCLRGHGSSYGIAAIGLTVAIGIVFFLFAHGVIVNAEEPNVFSLGHLQYLLMPIALISGIAIFPLTLIEIMILSAGLLTAFLLEMLSGNGLPWSQAIVAVLLMGSIIATAATCSVSQLKLLIDLHQQSTVDPLTGTLSRRAGTEMLDILFHASQRSNAPIAVALFDLDKFKLINDHYGHQAGDHVLREFAQSLKGKVRRQDALIRWGGEEFVLVLPNTEAANARLLITRLCQSGLGKRPDGLVQTASIGLAERSGDKVENWRELVALADTRMYAAKKLGRDHPDTAATSCRLIGDELAVTESPSIVASEPSVAVVDRRHGMPKVH
jgi:diguanylate cyclase (GGDEF)-like protein